VNDVLTHPDQFFKELSRWRRIRANSEHVRHLRDDDGNGDTRCEATDDGPWDKFDQGSHPGQTHDDQDEAGHDGCDHEPAKTMTLHYEENQWNESRRRPSYLNPTAA